MDKINMKELLKERWKFYVFTYIVGYLLSLLITGTPSFVYFIPIKLFAIIFTIFAGNAFYHASKKMPVYLYPMKGIKYVLVILVILIIFNLAKTMLLPLDIDLKPFIGAY